MPARGAEKHTHPWSTNHEFWLSEEESEDKQNPSLPEIKGLTLTPAMLGGRSPAALTGHELDLAFCAPAKTRVEEEEGVVPISEGAAFLLRKDL